MPKFTYLLVCQDVDGVQYVAECESWQAEVGALAVVDGALLEIVAVNQVAVDSDDYRFVAQLHDIRPATAIYRKVWEMEEEEADGSTAD